MDETVLITNGEESQSCSSAPKCLSTNTALVKACLSYVFSTSGFGIYCVYIKSFLKLLREGHL